MCFISFLQYVCVLRWFGCVRLFVTLWTVDLQAPLSMGFSRQQYWSGLPRLPPGDLPDPEVEPASLVSCTAKWGLWPRTGSYVICSPILRPLDLDRILPLGLLACQLAHSKLWTFLISIMAQANSCNKSPLKYIFQKIFIEVQLIYNVNFCCTAKCLSYTHTHIFSYSFPLWLVTGHWL